MIQRSLLATRVAPAAFWLLVAAALLHPAALHAQTKSDAHPVPANATPKSVDELLTIQREVQTVVAKVLPATVGIRIGSSQGSGVIVTADGYVLTAGHVVGRPGLAASIILSDGRVVRGKTLGLYETLDAGLIKIDGNGPWPAVACSRGDQLAAGAWCVAVGHPLGYQEGRPPVVRVGRVLSVQDHRIRTDCPLVAGDSGGPLFDLDGKVIGINSRIGGSTDMNYHIPVAVFTKNWNRLARGDFWEDQLPRRESGPLKQVLSSLAADATRCVVRIECQGSDVALGTIVGRDGWILTKASELSATPICRLANGRRYTALVVGVDKHFDLALLRIAANGLPSAPWSTANDSTVGQWVAAPGMSDEPPALGVVSVPRRRIPAVRGVLGVGVGQAEGGALIVRVMADTPAERAGLRENDVVIQINGHPVPSREQFLDRLHEHVPGDEITLVVRRGRTTAQLTATLDRVDTPASRKREVQNISDIGVSRRRDDFPVVLQHDTVLRPTDCGGPLVDLTGKVIGVNVARGGRTETYSVPTDVLLPLVEQLKTGGQTPAGEAVVAARPSAQPRIVTAARVDPSPAIQQDDPAPATQP